MRVVSDEAYIISAESNDHQTHRDKVGVTKLNETNAMVEGLKGDLTKLEPVLEQASKDAEKLLKQVEIDKADAAKVKDKVTSGNKTVDYCRVW